MLTLFYASLLVLLSALIFVFINKWEKIEIDNNPEELDFERLLNYVKTEINETMRKDLMKKGMSKESFERSLRNRSKFQDALKKCKFGSDNDKQFVKDVIYEIIKTKFIDENNINSIICFDNSYKSTAIDKFDILIYVYKKKYGKSALSQLISDYDLVREKYSELDESYYYSITEYEIEQAYKNYSPHLSYDDKLRILSQRLYQRYKGFSVVDEIRDMNIDGISAGVSGVSTVDIMEDMYEFEKIKKLPRNYESTWIFYEGKSVCLEFLSFDSESELKRVCQNIYRYNNAGMLSLDVGYKVSEMIDGSRVVVVRPDFSESWAFFVRKFQTKKIKLDSLIVGENANLAIRFIKYLAKGGRITAITGSQGSGKTTLLMAMIGSIYRSLTIRVQEMSFELHLRRLYPNRNILSFKETENISGQRGLDLQKKTDGSVNILGEVASDEVASWMIQMSQVASLFTIFTHHAKTTENLILSIRNSLLKCSVFRDEKIAEEQVVKVLNFDVHLKKDYDGNRYIERITEIKPIKNELVLKDSNVAISEVLKDPSATLGKGLENKLDYFIDNVNSYFRYISRESLYELNDIIVYEEGVYKVVGLISEDNKNEMLEIMDEFDRGKFIEYLQEMEMSLC